jgi:hypothetical protein
MYNNEVAIFFRILQTQLNKFFVRSEILNSLKSINSIQ